MQGDFKGAFEIKQTLSARVVLAIFNKICRERPYCGLQVSFRCL